MDKSKEQAKTVKLEMLAFVSPLALLKSIKQVKAIHIPEVWTLLEKKLMDLGGQAVYPNFTV